jgi:tRNA dimethylallyltransferase
VKSRSHSETIPLLAIAGPTAAGKTQLSLDLWQRLEAGAGAWRGAEIVSVDSAQIYRGMDIGTAKPDASTRKQVPHHLIDILDPAEAYSAARFAVDARLAIEGIRGRGRVPILVGGTLLYFRALFEGLSELPSAVPELRARIESEARAIGWPAMHRRLAEVDPPTAARLHPNDAQRIQRALEIHESSGRPASDWHAQARVADALGPVMRLALNPPEREERHRRIEVRFRAMVDAGFVDEVAALRARGDLHPGLPSMRAVGYRQLWRHLDGDCELDEAIRLGVIATRQYAKRQLTWLRAEPQWRWLDASAPGVAALVLSELFVAGGRGRAKQP